METFSLSDKEIPEYKSIAPSPSQSSHHSLPKDKTQREQFFKVSTNIMLTNLPSDQIKKVT
jgi:hypothetical protein